MRERIRHGEVSWNRRQDARQEQQRHPWRNGTHVAISSAPGCRFPGERAATHPVNFPATAAKIVAQFFHAVGLCQCARTEAVPLRFEDEPLLVVQPLLLEYILAAFAQQAVSLL